TRYRPGARSTRNLPSLPLVTVVTVASVCTSRMLSMVDTGRAGHGFSMGTGQPPTSIAVPAIPVPERGTGAAGAAGEPAADGDPAAGAEAAGGTAPAEEGAAAGRPAWWLQPARARTAPTAAAGNVRITCWTRELPVRFRGS